MPTKKLRTLIVLALLICLTSIDTSLAQKKKKNGRTKTMKAKAKKPAKKAAAKKPAAKKKKR